MEEPHPSTKPVVLLADNEDVIRNLMARFLEYKGHSVRCAADGHEALELSRNHLDEIDLVVIDLDMPGLNGMELCAHLAKERPCTKVVIISGDTEKKSTFRFCTSHSV